MADKKKKPFKDRIPTDILKVPIPYATILSIVLIVELYWWGSTKPELLNETLLWLFIFLPIVLPIALAGVLWIVWRTYVRAYFIAKQTPVLLEFKIPEHILKTPKAMEQVFMNLHVGPGESTFIARWITGKVRPWFSLEIVSLEGEVHMYIWTWKQFRNLIESVFYAQYPNVEINQVEDYTQGVFHTKGVTGGFGVEWALKKSDVYPIKTYIDLGLDQGERKAEQTIDPISGIFEKLSTFGPGEQFWIQILIRQNKGPRQRPVFWFEKPKKWTEEVEAEIEKIYTEAKPKKPEAGEENDGYPMLKPAQINQIKALERSMDKPAFDAAIRGVYVARNDSFDGTKIASFLSMWGSYTSNTLNFIVPGGPWHISLDYPWQEWRKDKGSAYVEEAIDAFRRRSFFHAPHNGDRKSFVLTTEELATLFHFPSEEVRAPGLRRIGSSKSEPPSNLPI